MARTTVDIETPILRELKAIQREEGLPLGKVISRLLADALVRRRSHEPPPVLKWASRPMRARVNLADKDALYAALDEDEM